jgi:hypothetical protein
MFFKTDSDEFQVNKSGIGIGAYLGVGVAYLDVAEKEYSYPHPIQQSFIEVFKLPKRFLFSLLDISFALLFFTIQKILFVFFHCLQLSGRVLFM